MNESTNNAPRITFDETMEGEIRFAGDSLAPSAAVPISLSLRIVVQDVDAFIADPAHEATASGTIACSLWGGGSNSTAGTFDA